jgi:hypothetical protein
MVHSKLRGGDARFETLTTNWDRCRFGDMMRKIEVLMINGNIEQACLVLRQFNAWNTDRLVSINDSVYDCLPLRLANTLADRGYLTLLALDKVTDIELLRIRNVSTKYVDLIRTVCYAAKKHKTIKSSVLEHEPDLEPEWEIDFEYLAKLITLGR